MARSLPYRHLHITSYVIDYVERASSRICNSYKNPTLLLSASSPVDVDDKNIYHTFFYLDQGGPPFGPQLGPSGVYTDSVLKLIDPFGKPDIAHCRIEKALHKCEKNDERKKFHHRPQHLRP